MKACILLSVIIGLLVTQQACVNAPVSKCYIGGTVSGVTVNPVSTTCPSASNYCIKYTSGSNNAKSCDTANLCTGTGEVPVSGVTYYCCNTDDCNSGVSIVTNKFLLLASLTLSVLFGLFFNKY